MATVSPVRSSPAPNVSKVLWEALATGDTINADLPSGTEPLLSSVQATGTFGGATVTLTGLNDGINYVTLKDPSGTDISFTAAGAFEFGTAMVYIKPAISGGTGDDVDVSVSYRG